MSSIVWYNINMTSNNAPFPYIANASAVHSGSKGAYTTFNSNTSDPFVTPDYVGVGSWVEIDFGEVRAIDRFEIYARDNTTFYVQAPKNVVIEYHNGDGKWSYTKELFIEGMASNKDMKNIEIGETIKAKVVRIKVTGLHIGNHNVSIGYIKFGYKKSTYCSLKNNNAHYSLDAQLLIHLPNTSPKNMISHGIEAGTAIQLNTDFNKIHYVNESFSGGTSGKITTQTLDKTVNKITGLKEV